MRWLKQLWHRWPFRTKLMVPFTAIFIVAATAALVVLHISTTNLFTGQVSYSAERAFNQAEEFLSYKVDSAVYAMSLLVGDPQIQEVLLKNHSAGTVDMITQNIDMLEMEKSILPIRDSGDVSVVRVYVGSELMYANQGVNFADLDAFAASELGAAFLTGRDDIMWLPPRTIRLGHAPDELTVISMFRKIRNPNQLNEVLGVAEVAIEASLIQSILVNSSITQDGIVLLYDGSGRLVSSSRPPETTDGIESLVAHLEGQTRRVVLEDINFAGGGYLFSAAPIARANWMLVAAIPHAEINAPSRSMQWMLLLILAGTALFIICFSLFFSKLATRRLEVLSHRMERFQNTADLAPLPPDDSGDEIGRLNRSFNSMLAQLEEMQQEVFEAGTAMKGLELRALQAQINPHFLYNALDLINWEALEAGAPQIADIARALGQYYKTGLSQGREIIPLREELRNAEAYVAIQNYRFDDSIRLVVDVPEGLMDCPIPKMVLQPLAENAILHGFLDGRRRRGTITIGASADGPDVLVRVVDDGRGMSPEQLAVIASWGQEVAYPGTQGYGIQNIHTRLQLYYGAGYGLSFRCPEGGGCEVTMKITRAAPIY